MDSPFALDASGRFILKEWQDEAVAYDLLSGDTHLLEPFALAVTRHLAGGARSREEVTERIILEFDLTAESITELIATTFAHLQRIGMVVAAPLDTR
jgi:PqqD family protein of HPr-rel-A system